MDKYNRVELHKFFHTNFGRMALDAISLLRRAQYPLVVTERFPELFSVPMATLLTTLHIHVQVSALRLNPVPLSHDALLIAFDSAIEELSKLS
jgi:hypothetical protein